MESTARAARREAHFWFIALGIACLLLGALVAATRVEALDRYRPIDFDLNWVAAQRLADGERLYDRAASRLDGVETVGGYMRDSNQGPYSSFIGAPPVALLHAPFLAAGHDDGLALFRLAMVLSMIAAVWLTTAALPRRSRVPVGLTTTGALLASWPFFSTVKIGQANGVMMLVFAAAAVGIARGRWRVVGLALGVGVALKVSPALIVLYLAARGRRVVVGWAALSAGSCALAALALGRAADTWEWFRHVLPGVSGGSFYVSNQSIIGAIARGVAPDERMVTGAMLGGIGLLAWVVIGVGGCLLWRGCRGRPVTPLELGIAILLVLFAGPLSWDYYFVWAYVPLVLVLDPRLWADRSFRDRAVCAGGIAVALMLLVGRLALPSVLEVQLDPAIGWRRNPYTLAIALLLLVAFRLRVGSNAADSTRRRSMRTEAVGDSRTAAVRRLVASAPNVD